MRSQTYLTPRAIEQLRRTLTTRDQEIIDTLAKTKYATARHIQQLHFTSGTPLSNARNCYRVLERLAECHILERFGRQFGGAHKGSSAYVYRLGQAGRLLAGDNRRHKPDVPSDKFIRHCLALTELYVDCRRSERAGRLTIRVYDFEPTCWRRVGPYDKRPLKPDGYAQLSAGGYRYYWFIELDLSSEIGSQLTDKLDRYERYYSTGLEQAANKRFPKVLFLVPTETRQRQIRALIDHHAARKLFRVELRPNAITALTGGPSL